MQIMITDNDFDQHGTPRGPLRQIVLKWADDIADLESPEPVSNSVNVLVGGFKSDELKNVTPITKHKSDPPPADPPSVVPGLASDTDTSPSKEEKPKKTRKRRSKEEIEAADDAACQLEIIAAKKEGRDPSFENLPVDTRKRVGKNSKSWIDPAVYKTIMEDTSSVPLEEDPQPVSAPSEETPDDPAPTDFSEFMDDGPSDPKSDATIRFEIGNKLSQLGQLNRAAAGGIVNAWKLKYDTMSTPGIPSDKLSFELRQVEAALDAEVEK